MFCACAMQIQTNVSPTPHTNPQTDHFTALFLFKRKSSQIYLKLELKEKRNKLNVYGLILTAALDLVENPHHFLLSKLYFKQALLETPFIWNPLQLEAGISTPPPHKNSF